jgi:hypothetical protein
MVTFNTMDLGCLGRRALVMPLMLTMLKTLSPCQSFACTSPLRLLVACVLAQEMRSLSCKELSLIAFLLDQIFLLKEVVRQQGGMVPPLVLQLLG